ncbi:MAG: Nif3-like dinuclear metal center hexameric protein, partial [Oscillospiraceae bacterium]|nr:Nif3-like dinuclear metal center hexameric protein [Oscillospiraceae bacterium]
MITPRELEQLVAQIAPPEAAEEWDNVGLLLDSGAPTDRILFALDATVQAVEEAKKLGCGVIVTHHPLIFHPLRRIEAGSPVQLAAKAGISVISAHTNFDTAAGGVNDLLAEMFGLLDV